MIQFVSIESLLTLIIGGVIGVLSTYLFQRRLFKREDKEKLSEEVYGKLYPLLRKAKIRHIPGELDFIQWPGTFWLTTAEILEIDAICVKYSHIIPEEILSNWKEAKERGPPLEGPDDAESDEIWHVYDLEEMLQAIEKELQM